MEEKRNFSDKLEAFFAGKGFYIVLLLSAAMIAASLGLMLSEKTDVEQTGERTAEEAYETKEARTGRNSVEAMGETPVMNAGMPTPVPKLPATALPENADPATETMEAPEDGAAVPVIAPETAGPVLQWPVNGTVERGHSVEALSYDRTMNDWRTHEGWDIAAPLGTAVKSAADGTVRDVYTHPLYGTVVEVDHGAGLLTLYANLAEQPPVSPGEQVRTGQIVGAVGDTAIAEAGEVFHLHFAVRCFGKADDPGNWLK